MILRLLKRIAPGLDVKAIGEEIRARIEEELDYELEAQNQRSLARIFRGHPFIVVPDVSRSLSRERVMVSEFVSGAGFEELQEAARRPSATGIGEIVFRFFFGCLYRHRQFSGDPHPGNFLLLDDGRDGVPRLRPVQADAAGRGRARDRRAARGHRGRRRDAHAAAGPRSASSASPRGSTPTACSAQFRDRHLVVHDATDEVELTPEIATQVMIDMSDPRSSYFGEMRHETCRPTTSSAGAWRCSRWPCSRSCRARATGTGSRASGSTATSR